MQLRYFTVILELGFCKVINYEALHWGLSFLSGSLECGFSLFSILKFLINIFLLILFTFSIMLHF